MLATLVREPFDKKGWVYEEKYDGYRLLAYKEGDRVELLSRNSIDRISRFPRIAEAIRSLRPSTLLLDGEVVAFDRKTVFDRSCASSPRSLTMRAEKASPFSLPASSLKSLIRN